MEPFFVRRRSMFGTRNPANAPARSGGFFVFSLRPMVIRTVLQSFAPSSARCRNQGLNQCDRSEMWIVLQHWLGPGVTPKASVQVECLTLAFLFTRCGKLPHVRNRRRPDSPRFPKSDNVIVSRPQGGFDNRVVTISAKQNRAGARSRVER